MKRRRHPSRRPAPASRGVSLLEVVLSIAVLSLVVATSVAALAGIHANQRRHAHELACAEVAHRLMLTWLLDEKSLPNRSLPIPYDASLYRWDLTVGKVTISEGAALRGARTLSSRSQSMISRDRLVYVTVNVWLASTPQGDVERTAHTPSFSLARIVDPLAFNRNPEAARTMLDPANRGDLLNRVLGGGNQ